MGYVDKALSAHLRSTLHAGFASMNGKVADITQADANKHLLTLAEMGLPLNTVAIIIEVDRIAGTGYLSFYPNEGTYAVSLAGSGYGITQAVIPVVNRRIQYALTVANDDFDLYCMGYWTSGRVTT